MIPPGTPGKTRLAKYLLARRLPQGDVTLSDKFQHCYLAPSVQEPIAFYLLIDGVYEPSLVDFLARYLKPGFSFVDVGANIGALTLLAGRLTGPDGMVLAIEPSPTVFPYLQCNIASNGMAHVRLEQCAASDTDGRQVEFYDAPVDHFGMGSLAPQFGVQPRSVVSRTLDAILEHHAIARVDVLKLDVEGFEFSVLSGARNLLSSGSPPIIALEFCDWAEARAYRGQTGLAQDLLREHGYTIWRLADLLGGRQPTTSTIHRGLETLVATPQHLAARMLAI